MSTSAPASTGAASLDQAWASIDWAQAHRQVTNLRQRLFRATQRQEWQRVRDQVNALPNAKRVHRNLQLKLVGAATFVEPDGSGRISLPASHRNAVGIDKKAVLLGMGDKFELWSEQAHLAQIRQTLTDADLTEVPLDLQL